MGLGMLEGRRQIGLALCALCLMLLSFCGVTSAQDLDVALSDAQSRAERASIEVSELQAKLGPAQERVGASGGRAAPAATAARAADRREAATEERLRSQRRAADVKLTRLEKDRHDAMNRRDETIRAGLGFALAMLVAAGIAIGWDWFRATALVAWLTRMSRGRAIGICVGGGLLMVIVGAAIGAVGGVAGVLGMALFLLGFVLANALVLARHSAEIQGGRERPLLRRERLPRRALQVLAGVLAALCLVGLGSAVFAGDASSSQASAALRYQASGRALHTPALDHARDTAARLDRRAATLTAAAESDRFYLQDVRRKLNRARGRLAGAEGDVSRYQRRLAIVAQRQQERAAQQAQQEAASQCDPNYSGCLDPNASDYDCEGGSGDGPLYTGTVQVLGYDHFGLDADGDGIGCDS